jgi:DNA-binding XRE family transcriptional regulator
MRRMVSQEDVRRVRGATGLDKEMFSLLLGVNDSTVFRWESEKYRKNAEGDLKMEPLQRELLWVLERALSKNPELPRVLRDTLKEGGRDLAFYRIYQSVFESV